jgi:hypothetical protein
MHTDVILHNFDETKTAALEEDILVTRKNEFSIEKMDIVVTTAQYAHEKRLTRLNIGAYVPVINRFRVSDAKQEQHLFRFAGFALGHAEADDRAGDTTVSILTGGMVSIRNGPHDIYAGDEITWGFGEHEETFANQLDTKTKYPKRNPCDKDKFVLKPVCMCNQSDSSVDVIGRAMTNAKPRNMFELLLCRRPPLSNASSNPSAVEDLNDLKTIFQNNLLQIQNCLRQYDLKLGDYIDSEWGKFAIANTVQQDYLSWMTKQVSQYESVFTQYSQIRETEIELFRILPSDYEFMTINEIDDAKWRAILQEDFGLVTEHFFAVLVHLLPDIIDHFNSTPHNYESRPLVVNALGGLLVEMKTHLSPTQEQKEELNTILEYAQSTVKEDFRESKRPDFDEEQRAEAICEMIENFNVTQEEISTHIKKAMPPRIQYLLEARSGKKTFYQHWLEKIEEVLDKYISLYELFDKIRHHINIFEQDQGTLFDDTKSRGEGGRGGDWLTEMQPEQVLGAQYVFECLHQSMQQIELFGDELLESNDNNERNLIPIYKRDYKKFICDKLIDLLTKKMGQSFQLSDTQIEKIDKWLLVIQSLYPKELSGES